MQFLIQCLSHTSPILRTQPAQETEYLTEQNRKFYWTGLYIPNIQMYKQAQREGVTGAGRDSWHSVPGSSNFTFSPLSMLKEWATRLPALTPGPTLFN